MQRLVLAARDWRPIDLQQNSHILEGAGYCSADPRSGDLLHVAKRTITKD